MANVESKALVSFAWLQTVKLLLKRRNAKRINNIEGKSNSTDWIDAAEMCFFGDKVNLAFVLIHILVSFLPFKTTSFLFQKKNISHDNSIFERALFAIM
jgi:hypothetical protein